MRVFRNLVEWLVAFALAPGVVVFCYIICAWNLANQILEGSVLDES